MTGSAQPGEAGSAVTNGGDDDDVDSAVGEAHPTRHRGQVSLLLPVV